MISPHPDGAGPVRPAVPAPREEATLLLREMNHRWFNALQAIAASLHQGRRGDSSAEQLRGRMTQVGEQVHALAAMHRRLSHPPEPGQSIADHCRAICQDVILAFQRRDIRACVEMCEVRLSPGQSLRLSLIVAELMTNALKHGLSDGLGGVVHLELRPLGEGSLELRATDTFAPPPYLDPPTPRLLAALTSDLSGEIAVSAVPGYATRIRFPVDPPPARAA